MQGQRSSVGSFPETFEFDHRSSLSNTGMDQEVYWSSMLLNPAEAHNLPNYLLSPSDANISYVNMSTQDSADLNIWNSGGPSSTEHSLNQGNRDEAKMEHGWSASLTTNAGGGPRIEERHFEAANMLSLENVNINLNSTQVDEGQSFSQNSNLNDVPQNPEHNAAQVGISGEVSESGLFTIPYNPGLLEPEHVPSSSNPCGSSSGVVGFMSEDGNGRSGSSLDGLRLGCKRKNIEGVPGQSSASGSASFFYPAESNLVHSVSASHNASAGINISSPSYNLSGANSSEEQLNPRFGTITRGVAPDCYPSASVAGNAESSQRNFRLRINPAHQHNIFPPNLYPSRDTIRRSSIWSPDEPSSQLIPFNQRLEPRPVAASSSSQSQPHIPVIPGLPRHVHPLPWDGAPNSRVSSLSSSVNSEERLLAMREDANTRSMPRNNVSEQSVFIPTTEIRHLARDSANWNVANGGASLAGNVAPTSRAGTSSGVHSSVGLTWVPHQNPHTQFSRSLAEAVRRTLLPAAGSESGGLSSNFPLLRSGHSATSQEIGHQPGSGSRGNQQPVIRSALLMDRQSDGVPLSMRSLAAREGRSRMISEIRNALDLMRRGENLRFEDVFMLDQSVFHGAADLHDRHRDMRLDVDNMSYEELLALEERIGNVSTGLSEETVLKYLKQWKHSSITVEASVEPEPCCICQEEYMEGENLGTLDCGHDFHTACIKQWLMHKNLCPICKTTALVT